jgi:L-lysine 6-transaminase
MPTTISSSKAKRKNAASEPPNKTDAVIAPNDVIEVLEKHLLVDGFKLVFDPVKSRGSRFVDASTGRELIDLYGFYGSQPLGFNHPHFNNPQVEAELLAAAKVKVANSDVYTVQLAQFVQTFERVMGLAPLERYFFIEGGGPAVENALKAAMDWKVRKNLEKGRGECGTEIIHFEHAFHGRTGYTLSLTNTDPRKTALFAKFPWPRIVSPYIDFSSSPEQRISAVIEKERVAVQEIQEALKQKRDHIAAIIIEPIQGEGGDNHFRAEFLRELRRICDENELLLIFDEVQSGIGLTGRNWCCEHFDVFPDLLVFGKKAQVCGVMAGPRLDEVKDNVFRLPSRISSTWGGNFTDAVRSTHFLKIIESEKLVENAARKGEIFLRELGRLAEHHELLTAVRGRGLMLAFDLPNTELRDAFWKGAFELGLLVVRSGQRSIRLRPVLDLTDEVIQDAIQIMDQLCNRIH